MEAVHHYKVLWGLLFGTIPILMWYHMSFSTALLSRLQLWHFIGWCPYSLWVTWIHKCYSCRTLPVVWRNCCYCYITTFRWCHPWKNSGYCCAPVPAQLLLAPSVRSTSQYSSCVYSVNIGYDSSAVICVSWVHLTTCFLSETTFHGSVCLKNYSSQDIYNILNLFFNKESHSGEHVHKFSFTLYTCRDNWCMTGLRRWGL
jgi:hypothetical protein